MAKMGTRQLALTCDRLGTSLKAGVDLLKLLEQESRRGAGAYGGKMYDVHRQVSGGATLAEALRAGDGFFPPLLCELVSIGEQTGKMDTAFLRLRDHYRHVLQLRNSFWRRLAWPIFELGLSAVVLGLLILLLGLITNNETGVFGLSGPRGLAIYVTIIGFAAGGGLLAIQGLRRGWFGNLPVELLMRIPVVGKGLQTLAMSRVAWTLSMALNAGIDAVRAIKLALNSTQSHYYQQHLPTAERVIVQGGQFHEALQQTGVFSSEFLMALENAEVSGTETESLQHVADDYQRRAESSLQAMAHIAAVTIWLGVMALIVFVIIDLVMDLYIGHIYDALDELN